MIEKLLNILVILITISLLSTLQQVNAAEQDPEYQIQKLQNALPKYRNKVKEFKEPKISDGGVAANAMNKWIEEQDPEKVQIVFIYMYLTKSWVELLPTWVVVYTENTDLTL